MARLWRRHTYNEETDEMNKQMPKSRADSRQTLFSLPSFGNWCAEHCVVISDGSRNLPLRAAMHLIWMTNTNEQKKKTPRSRTVSFMLVKKWPALPFLRVFFLSILMIPCGINNRQTLVVCLPSTPFATFQCVLMRIDSQQNEFMQVEESVDFFSLSTRI